MRKEGLGDVFRLLIFIAVSLLLAAVISPLIYKAGKNFADVFANKDTTDGLAWLAKKAAKAEFDTYFKRSLMLAALLGLWPLIHSIRSHRPVEEKSGWLSLFKRPSEGLLSGPRQCGTGFFISLGVFLIMTLLIHLFGWRVWDHTVSLERIPSFLIKSIQPAIFVSLFEEILFRGILMAIFLRAFKPPLAILGLSLLFAFVHFLQPPSNVTISNPYSLSAGFEMLQIIGQRFLEPKLILFSFAALFVTGVILAIARHRTKTLWLPVGIHAGWIFSLKFYLMLTERHPDHPHGAGIFLGGTMLEGVLPLAGLITTGLIVAIYLRKSSPDARPSP